MGDNPLLETQSFEPKEKDHDAKKDKYDVGLDSSRLNTTRYQSEKSGHICHQIDHSTHDTIVKSPSARKEEKERQSADTQTQKYRSCRTPEPRLGDPETLSCYPRRISGNGSGNKNVEYRRKSSLFPVAPGPERHRARPTGGAVHNSVNYRSEERRVG